MPRRRGRPKPDYSPRFAHGEVREATPGIESAAVEDSFFGNGIVPFFGKEFIEGIDREDDTPQIRDQRDAHCDDEAVEETGCDTGKGGRVRNNGPPRNGNQGREADQAYSDKVDRGCEPC